MIRSTPRQWLRQRGFGAIMAIIVIVILGALAVSIAKTSANAQLASAQDIMSSRALTAARTGNEWGIYQALRGIWTTCNNQTRTLDLAGEAGFSVTITCNSVQYNEGEISPGVPRTVRLFQIESIACNSATCPDANAATRPDYFERRVQVSAIN